MYLLRRQFLQLAAGTAALPVASRLARAQTYPARPVRIVVSYPAGNASDIIGRVVAQALSERLGQQFILENRPGVSGTLGTGVVARAAPDGYTLLMEVVTANVMNSTLYPNLNYDFARDIAPVARLAEGPYVVVLNPSVPAETLPELIAYAKANPGRINMASTGNGSPTHVFGELFTMTAGIDVLHVPYRGSFMPDLLGGQVQLLFGPISQSIEYIRAGKLRALAVTTANRQAALPDVPAVREFLPGYEASGWYGIGRAERHLKRDRRHAQSRDQLGARRSKGEGATRRSRGPADAHDAVRVRHVHCGRNRKMGQGDSGREHQGGLRQAFVWSEPAQAWALPRSFRPDHPAARRADPADTIARVIAHQRSDELLLFSSDYPHWQFDGDEILPKGLSPELRRKIMVDNPKATYRLS